MVPLRPAWIAAFGGVLCLSGLLVRLLVPKRAALAERAKTVLETMQEMAWDQRSRRPGHDAEQTWLSKTT